MIRDWPSQALRGNSLATLQDGLFDYLQHYVGFSDYRDVLVGLAPYYDCARRLGADPAVVFAEAASKVPDDVGNLALTFGQRTDVTLSAFYWELDEDSVEGPIYRSGGWPGRLPSSPSAD
jgi:hypothetical protein